jgi:hypothetical protein
MQAALLLVASVGEAGTAPAERTVVVPEVTAEMVQSPTPSLRIVMTEPTGIAAVALVGIFKAIAVALFIGTRT